MYWVLAAALGLAAAPKAAPLVIVIDPGHGGEHDGAVGPEGSKEKEIALQIAKQVAALAQSELSARVVLTRSGDQDVELSERVALANKKRANLFLSIHLNSMPTEETRRIAHGIETYFLSADPSDASAEAQVARENLDDLQTRSPGKRRDVDEILNDLALNQAQTESSVLAYAIHEKLIAATSATDRGVHQAPFFVLTGARMPAVLVEVGFISNPEEVAKLSTGLYQHLIAQSIVDGIREYEKALAPRHAAAEH